MSTAPAPSPPPAAAAPVGAAAPSSDKAVLLAAMKQRLAALEKTVAQKKQQMQGTTAGTANGAALPGAFAPRIHSPAPPATTSATPAAAAPAPSSSPLSALEQARALLAAKLAAKEARASPSPSPSPLPASAGAAAATAAAAPSVDKPAASAVGPAAAASALYAQARPFLPASAAASAAAGASTPATAAAAAGPPVAAAAGAGKPGVSFQKALLCRQWLTCPFGAKCRFRHPTVNTEAFFDYGAEVLLHLDATTATVAAAVGAPLPGASSFAPPTSMPPVLLLVLALLLESGPTETGGVASIPLLQLWTDVKTQLAGCRELPASQDDLLNSMGLPTTAAVMQRAADGQPVLSTDAFRKQYCCQFSITRQGGTFLVTHLWDEQRRAKLQEAVDLQKAQKAARLQKQKRPRESPSATDAAGGAAAAASYSFNSAAAVDADEQARKRKRVPDAVVYGDARATDASEAYPEDLAPQRSMASAAVVRSVLDSSTGAYSLDAGEFGGASSFIRGGIVTELSLMGAPEVVSAPARPPPRLPVFNPFDDPLARAIREGPKPVQRASAAAVVIVPTKKITSGKGYDMLQANGWTAGQGLGKRQKGRVEPLPVRVRADRSGLGF